MDFYASNFIDSPNTVVSMNAIERGEIENPYEIGSVNPWAFYGGGSRSRWFGTWEWMGAMGGLRATSPASRNAIVRCRDKGSGAGRAWRGSFSTAISLLPNDGMRVLAESISEIWLGWMPN